MSLLLNGSLEGKNPGEGDGRQEPELAFYREREMEDHGEDCWGHPGSGGPSIWKVQRK